MIPSRVPADDPGLSSEPGRSRCEESPMGRWTYYSPLAVGILLVLALNDTIRGALTLPDWQEWLIVAAVAVAAGVQCQVLMIGAQGAFAQVLPVPWGKSIRGGAAVLAGWLLIAWFVLSAVTALLSLESVTTAALVVGGLSLAALVGAGLTYVWSIPAAVADFGDKEAR
jgi:hypothetical protein